MVSVDVDVRPSDPKLLMFSWIVSVCRKLIPPQLRHTASIALFGVTPGIPVTLKSILPRGWPRRAFVSGTIIGFLFCFGVITVWTEAVGTFQGTDPRRFYFREDYANILNYTLLCPLYIGLGATLIVLTCQSWVDIQTDPSLSTLKDTRLPRLPLGIVFFVVIGLSAALTCNYIKECLDPAIYEKAGWYIARIDDSGQRILGILGVYYSLLTYSLFLIVLSATFSLFLLFSTAAEVVQCLRDPAAAPQSFEALRSKLAHFVNAYIVTKLFAATLMVNAYTWRASQQRHSLNLIGMGAALTIGGVFLISVPRYYIELAWFELTVIRARQSQQEIPIESRDLRNKNVRLCAFILDVLLFGSFIFTFWFS